MNKTGYPTDYEILMSSAQTAAKSKSPGGELIGFYMESVTNQKSIHTKYCHGSVKYDIICVKVIDKKVLL